MTRSLFRCVPFTIEQDQTAESECEARCVSGDETECGAESGTHAAGAGRGERHRHTQETGHRRCRGDLGDYEVMWPPAEPGELARTNGGRK